MKPITIEIQIDNPCLNYTENDCYEIMRQMNDLASKLYKFGYVKSQMYIGEKSYNGEPLNSLG